MADITYVALLAEGVDRNNRAMQNALSDQKVALLAEGVDRNLLCNALKRPNTESPSSRRAWIEIIRRVRKWNRSVKSPSSRRAWIEIIRHSL